MARSSRESDSSVNSTTGIFSMMTLPPPPPFSANRWIATTLPHSHSSTSSTTFWTKYCILCTICGTASTILAGIFLIVAALLRYHTTSIYYFETVPSYVPAILLSICGVSTIAFSCKRNRNIILLRITACWSLVSAALSSVITITTSLIHMNRLQTLKECVYTRLPPSCTCFGNTFSIDGIPPSTASGIPIASHVGIQSNPEPVHYVFENTLDCDVVHGVLYSCLRALFAISVVAVLLSIFLCMLLYQLIGHERKKAYWSRIRRINSDWSSDFLACLTRPFPTERSLLPLLSSTSSSIGIRGSSSVMSMPPSGLYWGPPPPYEDQPCRRPSFLCSPSTGPNQFESSQLDGLNSSWRNVGTSFIPTITTVVTQELGRESNAEVGPSTNNSSIIEIGRLPLRESKISIETNSEENTSSIEIALVNTSNEAQCVEQKASGNSSLPCSPVVDNLRRLILRRRVSGVLENLSLVRKNSVAGKALEGQWKKGRVSSQSLPGSPFISRNRTLTQDELEIHLDNELC